MWSFSVHDTITGAKLLGVRREQASGRWGRTPGAGDGEHTLVLGDADEPIAPSDARRISEPNATTFVVAWSGVPMYAGLIIEGRYNRASSTLKLRHNDIRVLFSQRLTFGVTSYSSGDLTLTNRGLYGLTRGILQRAIYDWSATWRLPIDLPNDTAGVHSMAVKKWEWAKIEDLLVRVEKLGATIDFDPYFDASENLRWSTRVGTPTLSGPQFEWVVTADDTPVTELEVTRNGSKQLSGCFYTGKGSEADKPFGEAGFIGGPTIPVRDAQRSAIDVGDVDKLNQMALFDLQQNRSPKTEWSFDLVADGSWDVSQLRPGARIKLWTYGDAFIQDGSTDLVVTGVSGDMSNVLKPEVMPL